METDAVALGADFGGGVPLVDFEGDGGFVEALG